VDAGERLRAAELRVRLEGAPLGLVAEVRAEMDVDPMQLTQGEPLPLRP
jgi:hypothetical protein